MKTSAKAKRIQRHQRRGKQQGKLNLVSLMDIFTILVFFLMVNASDQTSRCLIRIMRLNYRFQVPIKCLKM